MPQQPAFPPETLSPPQPHQDRRTEFVYPYNFVPHGGPRRGDHQPQGMGADQPFKHLHRFDGLTGRIEYTLTALSPLFVADSEGTTIYELPPGGEEHRHRVMDFFNVQGGLCLPGTSLKGVVRSVAEAASNSTMGVLEEHRERFTYRKVTDIQNRRCGKWTANGTIQPWSMAKLPLSSLIKAVGLSPSDPKLAEKLFRNYQNYPVQVRLWKIHTGIPVVAEFELNGVWHSGVTLPTPSTIVSSAGTFQARPGPGNKRMVSNTVGEYYCPNNPAGEWTFIGPGNNFIPLNATISFKAATFPELGPSGRNRVFEISHVGRTWSANNPTLCSGELLFHSKYDDPNARPSKQYVRVLYRNATPTLPVSHDALNNYRTANGSRPAVDSIVYYETDQQSNQVIEFGPAAVFKSAEPHSSQRLFRQVSQFAYPTSRDRLCPATRLFGWTPEAENEGGVAGRVSFSMAWSDRRLEDTHLVPLKILGSPKPKYYPFYLRPADGQQPSTRVAYYTEHQEPPWAQVRGTPRGRKSYLHHPQAMTTNPAGVHYAERTADEVSQEARDSEPTWPHSHQNATCAVLPAGATFRGVIEFDALDPYELGLLLWSLTFSNTPLQASPRHAHKLGMGKGIGLGSVRFHLERVVVQEPEKAWIDLDHPENDGNLEAVHERPADADELAQFVRRFKTWMISGEDVDNSPMVAQYDTSAFAQDLLAVTRVDLVSQNDRIQYYPHYWREGPRGSVQRWYADKGFTYFVDQRQKRGESKEEPLRAPTAIQQGYRQGR